MKLETDTLLIFAPDGQPAASRCFMEDTPPTPYDVDTWVHPAFVEADVGDALLQWIDQRAQQALTHAPADVPVSIEHVYVYAQNRSAQQRLEKFGYQRERIFYRMEIVFDAPPPEPQLPTGSPSDRSGAASKIEQCMKRLTKRKPTNGDKKIRCRSTNGCTTSSKWKRTSIPQHGSWPSRVRPSSGMRCAAGIARANPIDRRCVIWRCGGRGASAASRWLCCTRRSAACIDTANAARDLGVDATSYTGADRLYVRAGMHRAFETLRYRKVLRDA